MEGSPFIGKKPVVHLVMWHAFAAEAAGDDVFELHARLLHHPSRSRVPGHVVRSDVEQPLVFEGVAKHAAQGLGHVAAPPIRHAKPITDRAADTIFARSQCDQSDHLSELRFEFDRKGDFIALLQFIKPPDRIADAIGMGHTASLQGDAWVTDMSDDSSDVPTLGSPQVQAFGFKDGANGSNDSLHN